MTNQVEVKFDINNAFEQLNNAFQQYGPTVYSTVLQLKQADSIIALAWGGVGFLMMLISFWLIRVAVSEKSNVDEGLRGFSFFGGFFLLVVGGLTFAFNCLDFWNWVGAFNPQLALAHDILVKVTQ